MSKIEEERDYAIEENTAQVELITLLDRMDAAHADELRVDQALRGDIDFSVLRDRGFTHITKIVLSVPGEITSIRNVPQGIVHLECREQLLTEIGELPASLEEIDLTENSIQRFNGRNLAKLRVLRISNNELEHIEHLSETLETIECENNQLRRLDLSNTRALKSLHCSNNPLLVLEHVPATLTDLVMENNPFVEIDRSAPAIHGASHREKNARYDYLETIQEYFRLKHEYDVKVRKMKRAAFERASNRRGGTKAARHVRAPCVSCKRPVGTVFKRHDGRYTAVCGDTDKPCNLDIQIFTGDFFNLYELLNLYKTDAVDRQEKVIMQKLDALFHYISETAAVKKFKEELEEYNFTTSMEHDVTRRYNELYANEEHAAQIARKVQEMYRIQGGIRVLMAEYAKTGNGELLSAAIERQIKDLEPVIHSLRMLKYEVMTVEIEEKESGNIETAVSTLVQSEVAPYKQDFTYGEGPRVIKYVVSGK